MWIPMDNEFLLTSFVVHLLLRNSNFQWQLLAVLKRTRKSTFGTFKNRLHHQQQSSASP